MSHRALFLISIALLLAVAAWELTSAHPGEVGAAQPLPPLAAEESLRGEPAVVLELFTSQGCSSCPAADRLLSRLGGRDDTGQTLLVPLAFHVDYWNYIGWSDPFSSAAWSERQRRYGSQLGLRTVYTPQLVVNGTSECVGSDERAVRAKIAAARQRGSTGRIELVLRPSTGQAHVDLEISARAPTDAALGNLEAWVAVFESGLSTKVGRGENAHRTLRNDFVVRRLQRAFSLPLARDSVRSQSLSIALEASWRRQNLGVAAFLQEQESLRIHTAAVARLSDLPATSG